MLGVFGLPGGWEWIAILAIGLLLFGRRLPEVGRSLGRSIIEFKKGLKGIEEETEENSAAPQVGSGASRPALSGHGAAGSVSAEPRRVSAGERLQSEP